MTDRDPNARDLAVILLNAQLIQSHTREREWAARDHDMEKSAAENDAAWAAYSELVDAVTRIAKRNGTDWYDLTEIRDGLSTRTNAEDVRPGPHDPETCDDPECYGFGITRS